ncbi:MAG: flagellar biosynthetic protein FliO [Fimbriimonadaceae bacterium]|nr:flagellar biosynthetic protein FliO [Fimbriimonadaceae bacterium]
MRFARRPLRPGLAIAAVATAQALAAQGTLLGTKRDLSAGSSAQVSSSGNGTMVFLQTIVALVIVFAAIKYLLPRFAGKINRKLSTKLGSAIEIEESAAFAGGALYLVNVRGKSLLLSVTGQNVSFLSEVPAQHLDPAPVTFGEMLREAPGTLELNEEPAVEAPKAGVEEALRRLAKLGGAA